MNNAQNSEKLTSEWAQLIDCTVFMYMIFKAHVLKKKQTRKYYNLSNAWLRI